MNATLVIAGRELREKKRMFVMAAALALLPFIIALMPAAAGQRDNAIGLAAGILALAMAWGTALVLGSTTVSREIAEKRFSFHLSKPVSPAAIWAGKSLGAIATSLLCLAIIATPASVAAWNQWRAEWPEITGIVAIGSVVIFLISHAASTMIRSRSVWIALDFVLLAIALLAVWTMARSLLLGGGLKPLSWLSITVAALVCLALAVVPVVQIARGRGEIRQSHAALSRAFWPAVGVIFAVAGAYVLWLVMPSLGGIEPELITQSPSGNFALVAGPRAGGGGYEAAFLVDAVSGDHRRLGAPVWWGPSWSRDGRVAAFGQPHAVFPFRQTVDLYTSTGGAPPVATGLPILGSTFVLSDDGSRVAILRGGTLSVFDLPSRRLLASASGFTRRHGQAMLFVSPDRVRVYDHERGRNSAVVPLTLHELDIPSKSIVRADIASVPVNGARISLSGDGSRMLIRATGTIADARTGRPIATVPLPHLHMPYSAMLHDGSVVVSTREKGAARIRIYTPDGASSAEVTIPHPRAFVTGETAGGKLIVAGMASPGIRGSAMFVIDRATAKIERTIENVRGPWLHFDADPRFAWFAAGSQLMAIDADHRVILWDPRTGERRSVQ